MGRLVEGSDKEAGEKGVEQGWQTGAVSMELGNRVMAGEVKVVKGEYGVGWEMVYP